MTQLAQSGTGLEGNTDSSRQKARGWSWTLNNFTEADFEMLKAYGTVDTEKFVIGKEHLGAGEGTPHLQGYFYFKNARSFNSLKQLHKGLHLEVSKGNAKSNFDYCRKEGLFVYKGFKEPKPINNELVDFVRHLDEGHGSAYGASATWIELMVEREMDGDLSYEEAEEMERRRLVCRLLGGCSHCVWMHLNGRSEGGDYTNQVVRGYYKGNMGPEVHLE